MDDVSVLSGTSSIIIHGFAVVCICIAYAYSHSCSTKRGTMESEGFPGPRKNKPLVYDNIIVYAHRGHIYDKNDKELVIISGVMTHCYFAITGAHPKPLWSLEASFSSVSRI